MMQQPQPLQEPNYDFIMYMMAESHRKNPKKQKHVYAMCGSITAAIVSIAQIATYSMDWNFMRAENIVYGSQVNLFNVHLKKGTAPWLLSGISTLVRGQANVVSSVLDAVFEHDIELQHAKEIFCAPAIPSWMCDEWSKAWLASWALVLLGYSGAIFLGAGGYMMYYYVKVHATEVGRKCTVAFLALAPLCSLAGIATYSALTMDFGKSGGAMWMLGGSNSMWGIGWIVSVWLHVMSWVPIYIMAMFSKRSATEKVHGEHPDDFALDYDGGVYGSTGQGAGVGQQEVQQQWQQPDYRQAAPIPYEQSWPQQPAPASGWGAQPQPQLQQAYSGGPTMGTAYPSQAAAVHGMGAAAW